MLFRAGFGRYVAALMIIRQSPRTDLYSKSAATAPKFWVVKKYKYFWFVLQNSQA